MNFWIQIVLLVLATGCFVGCEANEHCSEPEVDDTPPLDPAGAKTFNKKKVAKLLKKKPYKAMKIELKEMEKAVDETVKDKSDGGKTYPECTYENMCTSKTVKAKNWKVNGEDCWLLEPVAWTECAGGKPPTMSCSEADTGHSCKNVYTQQSVWVYCNSKSNPIKLMEVGVSTGCREMMHDCS